MSKYDWFSKFEGNGDGDDDAFAKVFKQANPLVPFQSEDPLGPSELISKPIYFSGWNCIEMTLLTYYSSFQKLEEFRSENF